MLEKSYARYEAALHGLHRYARKLKLEGHSYFEYGRVAILADRLDAHYARYRKNGDMSAILKELAHYEADAWGLNYMEDGLVPTRLGELLHELKQGVAGLTLTVSAAAPTEAPVIEPGKFLTLDASKLAREAVTH